MSISKAELKLLEITKQLALMRTKDDCIAFEENVYHLSQNKSPEMLQALLDLFYDDCPFYEVMFALVHIVETYPIDIYIDALLHNIKYIDKYKKWFLRLLKRIENHQEYRQNLIRKIQIVSKDSSTFFDQLRGKNPQCISEINELEKKCSN